MTECPYGYEEISGNCIQCKDPTNCPYVEPPEGTPTEDEVVDDNVATAFPDNTTSDAVV